MAESGASRATARSGPAVRRLGEWNAARLRALAETHDTPLYVQDLGRVRENAARLRGAFPEADLSYAVKANTTRAVLETVEATGLGAECASAGEVQRALDAGFSTVRYTAVNPPDADLDRVVALADDQDVTVTVGAADTLERLEERDYDGPLCVRVNPGVGAGHHAKVTTGTDPTFGVPYDRAAAFAERAAERHDLVGIHAHAGSGISGEDLSAHRELVGRMGDLARELDVDLEFVNVGGGFGVPYRPEEPPLDLERVAEATREAFGEVGAQLGIEPGRYLVADAGVLLARVNTVKPTPETLVVGVDAGMTTLARPALYDAYHDLRLLAADAGERERREATVAGPVCETADVLATDRSLPAPERGDLMAVGNAGAYGYEMASQYNSRPRPAVVSLPAAATGGSGETAGTPGTDRDASDARLSVRRESIADLTRLEVNEHQP